MLRTWLSTVRSEAFRGGPGLIGTFFAAAAADSLLGTLVFAARGGSTARTDPRTALGMVVALLATALAPHELLALPRWPESDSGGAYLLGTVVSTLQRAEPNLMGRVMSVFAMVLLGGTTIGGPLATAYTTVVGSRAPFVLGAVAAVIAAASRAMHRPPRRSQPAERPRQWGRPRLATEHRVP